MKDLQSQFDQLPQGFDREAIWAGVKKPKPPVYFRVHFWVGAGLAIALLTAGLLAYLDKPDTSRRSALTTEQLLQMGSFFLEQPLRAQQQRLNGIPWSVKGRQQPPSSSWARIPDKDEDSTDGLNSKGAAHARLPEGNPVPEAVIKGIERSNARGGNYSGLKDKAAMVFEDTAQTIIASASEPEHLGAQATPSAALPLLATRRAETVATPERPLPKTEVVNPTAKLNSRHSLALRAGVGIHRSRFFSPEAERLQWRAELEQPQLGYWLGLRYEYRLKHQILLSLSANYYLYKERVLSSNTLYLPGQVKQLDYKLHNHYHVFTTQVELGKRFFYGSFFWDVTAGGGLKAHQLTEADYFQSASELAPSEQVQAAYRSSARAFATAQAAVGRQLNQRVFVRLGAQFSSGLELTAPQAAVKHQLRPYQFFVEAGVRL